MELRTRLCYPESHGKRFFRGGSPGPQRGADREVAQSKTLADAPG